MNTDGDGFCQLCRWPHYLPSPQERQETHGQQACVTSSRRQLQGELGELANSVHLSHASLVLTAGNFSKDRDPRGEISGSLNPGLEHHLSSSIHEWLPKQREIYFSGCFSY